MFCPPDSWLALPQNNKAKQARLITELFTYFKAAVSVFSRLKGSRRLTPRYHSLRGIVIQIAVEDKTVSGRLNDLNYQGLSFIVRRQKLPKKLLLVFPEINLQLIGELKWIKEFTFFSTVQCSVYNNTN